MTSIAASSPRPGPQGGLLAFVDQRLALPTPGLTQQVALLAVWLNGEPLSGARLGFLGLLIVSIAGRKLTWPA